MIQYIGPRVQTQKNSPVRIMTTRRITTEARSGLERSAVPASVAISVLLSQHAPREDVNQNQEEGKEQNRDRRGRAQALGAGDTDLIGVHWKRHRRVGRATTGQDVNQVE